MEAAEPDPSECPFCERHEAETPPETLAIGPPDREPDTPGWHVRVFPNLYPAFVDPAPPVAAETPFVALPARGRQEIVVHVPRHARSLAELAGEEVIEVAEAWRRRAGAARDDAFAYMHAFVNEGWLAGASRAHSHSQLVSLVTPPPRMEQPAVSACPLCDMLGAEREAARRIVLERSGVVLLCPFASRAPYELLAAPVGCETDAFASRALAPALALVTEGIRRIRTVCGPAPLNLWLRTSPFGEASTHWHLTVRPRLTIPAGLELGTGIDVNPLPPEQAADGLRAAA